LHPGNRSRDRAEQGALELATVRRLRPTDSSSPSGDSTTSTMPASHASRRAACWGSMPVGKLGQLVEGIYALPTFPRKRRLASAASTGDLTTSSTGARSGLPAGGGLATAISPLARSIAGGPASAVGRRRFRGNVRTAAASGRLLDHAITWRPAGRSTAVIMTIPSSSILRLT
jgi:hypothetical protein